MRPKKNLGQHFLKDRGILQELVEAIEVRPTDYLLEIGPGCGALTEFLVARAGKLFLVEFDSELIPILQRRFGSTVTLFQADILKFDFELLPTPIRVVGNLPYNISTPILFKLLSLKDKVKDLHLMFQQEVAARLVASPGTKAYGRLSVMFQSYYQANIVTNLTAEMFHPAPKVNSTFIRAFPIALAVAPLNFERFSFLVREAFNSRRKTLHNALKKYISKSSLARMGVVDKRPEELSVLEFIELSNLADNVCAL